MNACTLLYKIVFILGCAVFLCTVPIEAGLADDSATLQAVLQVWRNREASTKSFRVEIEEEHLTGRHTGNAGPPRATTKPMRRVLMVDGTKMHHRRSGEVWTDALKEFSFEDTTSVFDGRQLKTLCDTEKKDDLVHPHGWITARGSHSDALNVYIGAVLRHFRPLSTAFGLTRIDKLAVVSSGETIDGVRCLLLQESRGSLKWRYYVAPEQQMSIIRFTELSEENEVTVQNDVVFEMNEGYWLPKQWSALRLAGKETMDAAKARVAALEINSAIPGSAFDIQFPPGTEVYDRVGNRNVVIQEDGTWRRVLRMEVDKGAKYAELMRTPTGMAGNDLGAKSPRRLGITVFVLLIIGFALFLVIRRAFRSHT